jgi:hypothetical protein
MSESAKPLAETTPRTEYIVLRRSDNDGHVWVWDRNVEARSADAAVRVAANQLNDNESKQEVTFVAVPTSSWKPRAATIVIDRKVVLA